MCLIEVKMARIMIADDSELVRSTLKDMLELGKHQVVSEQSMVLTHWKNLTP